MKKLVRLMAFAVTVAILLTCVPFSASMQQAPLPVFFPSTPALLAASAFEPNVPGDTAVPFSDQIVISESAMGAHSVASVDFDRDGRIDILSASREDGQIVWHRNVGNLRFTPFVLGVAAGSYVALPVDVDKDGYTDVLVAAVSILAPSAAGSDAAQPTAGDGSIFWLRNNLGNKVLQFTRYELDAGLAYPVSVHAADIDADGDTDLLATTRDGNQVLLYEHNGASGVPAFNRRVLDGNLSGAVSAITGDIDGDGKLDIIATGENNNQIIWYRNNGARPADFDRRLIRNGPAPDPTLDYAKTVAIGDLDRDGDLDIAFGSENENLVGWYENQGRGASFSEHVLTTIADHVKQVRVIDIDRDGDLDLLAASSDDNTVALFENNGATPPTFVRKPITVTAMGARSVHGADFDRDGDIDVVVASRQDNRIILHLNNSIHRSALLESERVVNTFSETRSVAAADIDGDGRQDILSTANNVVAWHRNLGGSPPNFETVVIDNGFSGGRWVTSGDIDNDGDIDIAAADRDTNRIMLYENLLRQTGAPGFAPRLVTSAAIRVRDVHMADIDGDGDLDLYSASDGDNVIAWYENVDGAGFSWVRSIVSNQVDYPRSSYAADLDGDGRLDLMSASARDNRVTMFRQTSPRTFTHETIYANANGAQFIHSADIDKDGDMDIIVSSERDNTVSWFANRMNAGLGFPRYVVSDTAYGVHAAIAADMDGDGDLDIVGAIEYANQIVWYENLGGVIPTWTEHLISPFAQVAHGIAVADLDGDGDLDALSASRSDGKVAWHENRGGQFHLTQAPHNNIVGGQRLLMETTIAHRGRAGNPMLRLDTLTLRFEREDGRRLGQDEVVALFNAFLVYQDNGDGQFNPTVDPLVKRETLLFINDGELLIDLPSTMTAPGAVSRYFVTVEEKTSQCGVGPVTVSIITNGRTAVDGVTGVPLLGEYMRTLIDTNDPSQNRKVPVVINEMMADNQTKFEDPDEPLEYPDWFELYNPSNLTIEMGGMYLTDDPTNLRQYRIPDGVLLAPRSFLLFIADNEPEQGQFHVPFNLNRDGETLVLYDIDERGNQVIDQVTFGSMAPDTSLGRSPSDAEIWVNFDLPSPGDYNIGFAPSSFTYLPSITYGDTCN